MDWVEVVGYIASALVFATFWMRTFLSARLVAMASNVFFILYAVSADLTQILLLHALLLPLNIYRTGQQLSARRRIKTVIQGTAKMDSLVPLMRRQSFSAGDVLFKKDQHADQLFYLDKGEINLPELGKTLGNGTFFGEIGLFTPDRKRTATAVCATDCDLLVISDPDIMSFCLKDPGFGLFLTRLIARRLS